MKFKILYSDAAGLVDGVTHDQLVRHIPSGGDIPILLTVCGHSFKFNHEINNQLKGRKYIHVDYLEWGWQWDFKRVNEMGRSECYPCGQEGNHDWGTLHSFLADNPPVLTFQRELRRGDVRDNLIPIDFLCTSPAPRLDTKDEFNNRPYDVFSSWGYSHPNRARVHGDIFHAMGRRGINVIDGYDKLGGNSHHVPARTWLSIFTPHWVRKPMAEVLKYQAQSKISLSLYGAGAKCFRDAEAPVGSIMAHQTHWLARSYEWDDTNSVRINEPNEVPDLLRALENPDLYDIYCASQDTIDKYRIHRYWPEYVLRNIQERL